MNDLVEQSEATATVLVPSALTNELSITKPPAEVLVEAQRAADALLDLVRKKNLAINIRGKDHLMVEAWETLGTFYGVTARIVSTEPVAFGEVRGFKARSEAMLVATGRVISAAESMCLNDEKKWRDSPTFQLLSMAQTRAISKCLRNVLAWIVVMAGFSPTPADEMTGDERNYADAKPKPKEEPNAPEVDNVGGVVERAEVVESKQGHKFLAVKFVGQAAKYTTFDDKRLDFDGGLMPLFEFIPRYAPSKYCSFGVVKNKTFWNITRVLRVGQYSWDADGTLVINREDESFDEGLGG
jgi:hypothetical protein